MQYNIKWRYAHMVLVSCVMQINLIKLTTLKNFVFCEAEAGRLAGKRAMCIFHQPAGHMACGQTQERR